MFRTLPNAIHGTRRVCVCVCVCVSKRQNFSNEHANGQDVRLCVTLRAKLVVSYSVANRVCLIPAGTSRTSHRTNSVIPPKACVRKWVPLVFYVRWGGFPLGSPVFCSSSGGLHVGFLIFSNILGRWVPCGFPGFCNIGSGFPWFYSLCCRDV